MKNFFLTLGAALLLILVAILILGAFTVISWNVVLIVGVSAIHLAGLIFGAGLLLDIIAGE